MVIFRDRADAGRQLARELRRELPHLPAERPVVLAIPRGGVPVGYEIALALGAPLDIILARKLGAPGQEELGIGAIAPGGTRVLDQDSVRMLGVTEAYIEQVTAREQAELERRMRAYRGSRAPVPLAGRAVVVVDDGLATGVTARAALAAARHAGPRHLIFAAPVCSAEGCALLSSDADAVVCAAIPPRFYGVGTWYADFEQVTDAQVLALLDAADRAPHASGAPATVHRADRGA